MGFRLPVIGYVSPRGAGGENAPKNAYNVENTDVVERIMRRLELIYEDNRENSIFVFGDDADRNRTFIGTHFENSRAYRDTLRAVFAQLPQGGIVVTPNVHHLVEREDMSVNVIRDNMYALTGFLFTDEIRFLPIQNMRHIEAFIFMAMSNLRRVENSMTQIEAVNATRNRRGRRRNAFLGV